MNGHNCCCKCNRCSLGASMIDAGRWQEHYQKLMKAEPNSINWLGWARMEEYWTEVYQNKKKEYFNK